MNHIISEILMKVKLFLLSVLFFMTCEDKIVSECATDDIVIDEKVTYGWIQQNVFTPGCAIAGCHAAPNPAENLDLSQGQSYDQLVSVASSQAATLMRILPNNSSDSYLVIKLAGNNNRMQGSVMPPGGPYLNQTTIDSLEAWIDRGALEN
jgi:hypothetical protein